MYLSMLAQMEDRYPPPVVREAEHRRVALRVSRRPRRRPLVGRLVPFRRRAAQPCADDAVRA
jgi:hypothetical protein